ncbi:MAG: enoyl-CoA hydratase [Gammaproteobacteria bacterium]|nr:enoyl-CoA hydratase [Gammaproteobacteria bacterium]MYF30425.1 enoyl-CoA hydratase [Gammaproteobacteria bacterium]MYK47507.1 enoyl-CoA hydratase [Gammaproteobacteria bacterium]
MSTDVLLTERHDHVAVLTLNRPRKLNALDADLRDAMLDAVASVQSDDDVRAVIFTGAGRGFCSGADLTSGGRGEPTPPTQMDRLDDLGWVGRQALAVYGLDKPVIAAVNGVAAGAGMSLSLACDLRVGSEKSRFKTIFIERNLSPDSGMSFFLPRIVGYSRAADLVYTSRTVDAEEAHRIGLLDRLVDHDELLERAIELASQMADWPPLALRVSKRVLQHNVECDLGTALRHELTSLSYGNRAVNDRKESLAAFREKRKPTYTGT